MGNGVGKGTEKAKVSGDLRHGFLRAKPFQDEADLVLGAIEIARGAAMNIGRSASGQACKIRDDNALPTASDDPSMRQPRQFA